MNVVLKCSMIITSFECFRNYKVKSVMCYYNDVRRMLLSLPTSLTRDFPHM